jgi:RNA 2',3'-cyclic 3'-phosphodiesterase
LFFAALPAESTRDRIAGAAEALHASALFRYVPRENYHLTLAFIGEVRLSQVPLVQHVGGAVNASAFSLRFDAYEYWPNSKVVVAAARVAPAALERLWSDLHRGLAAHQRALEPNSLRPHVTLARKVSQPPVLQAMSAFDWDVGEFSLMRSETLHGRTAYTVVDTWSLLYDSAKT